MFNHETSAKLLSLPSAEELLLHETSAQFLNLDLPKLLERET